MKVYKFGGASVKDAEAVRNVGRIIKEDDPSELWMVVSAMGKTTNSLEVLVEAYTRDFENMDQLFNGLKDFHLDILRELFPFGENEVWNEVEILFAELEGTLNNVSQRSYSGTYAAAVSIGELLSTRVVSAYLESIGVFNYWLDAREYIHTDLRHQEAKVDMLKTKASLSKKRNQLQQEGGPDHKQELIIVTQGFIGSCDGETTTLGREGSDYTGGILAWCLDALELSIWKDVPGMLNADPKYYPDAQVIERLSYHEAIELSYYGASVIHPKTLKPLQNKAIPLYVRSFMDPEAREHLFMMR